MGEARGGGDGSGSAGLADGRRVAALQTGPTTTQFPPPCCANYWQGRLLAALTCLNLGVLRICTRLPFIPPESPPVETCLQFIHMCLVNMFANK